MSTEKALDNGHHHRCYRNKATEQYPCHQLSRSGVSGLGGLEISIVIIGSEARAAYGVIPCNGLIYSTPHPCDCYISSKLNGFYALAPTSAGDRNPEKWSERIAASEKGLHMTFRLPMLDPLRRRCLADISA